MGFNGSGTGNEPTSVPPVFGQPDSTHHLPAHVSWWTELNRASKLVVILTGFLVFWTMIGDNMTSCIDKAVTEKKESAKIEALETKSASLELEQAKVQQKIANFEANFSIQTAEIGEARQDISEVKDDVKQIQQDIKQVLILMAEKEKP